MAAEEKTKGGGFLEVCVDSFESAENALIGGADRLEVCSGLIIGGLSPSLALLKKIKRQLSIEARVLLRPRFGDFLYTCNEVEIILEEIRQFEDAGADGVVVGFLTAEGALDLKAMEQAVKAAGQMKLTLHRAFDLCADPFEALRQCEALGISTILTSGQQATALAGMDLLRALAQEARQVEIMAGAGINAEAIEKFLASTDIRAYHMSGKITLDSEMAYRKENVPMGLDSFDEYTLWRTDSNAVRRARAVLEQA